MVLKESKRPSRLSAFHLTTIVTMVSLSTIRAHFFPPKPQFTDKDVPDLHGKVYIVTGANSGIGRELAYMLYSKNAKVYVGARSEEKANNAISSIRNALPASTGSLVQMHIDLSDLEKVKAAARHFLAEESKLNALFNNAGVMVAPVEPSPKTTQGYELALGVNCVGTFLLSPDPAAYPDAYRDGTNRTGQFRSRRVAVVVWHGAAGAVRNWYFDG